jgi:hypothetical protein
LRHAMQRLDAEMIALPPGHVWQPDRPRQRANMTFRELLTREDPLGSSHLAADCRSVD